MKNYLAEISEKNFGFPIFLIDLFWKCIWREFCWLSINLHKSSSTSGEKMKQGLKLENNAEMHLRWLLLKYLGFAKNSYYTYCISYRKPNWRRRWRWGCENLVVLLWISSSWMATRVREREVERTVPALQTVHWSWENTFDFLLGFFFHCLIQITVCYVWAV